MGNTVLEPTGLGSTLKRIRCSVSGTYICDGIEHTTGYSRKNKIAIRDIFFKFSTSLLIYSLYSLFNYVSTGMNYIYN